MLNKQTALKIVNPLFGLAFLIQLSTGFAMKYDGSHYELWSNIHCLCAWAVIAIFALHIWLNWNWIKANMLKGKAKG